MKLKILTIFFCSFSLVFIFRSHDALAFAIGETKTFFVDSSYDYSDRKIVSATLRQVGEKAIFFVEDDWWAGLSNKESVSETISKVLDEFDKVIYPRLTSAFGSEWSPGIDNEYRITILVTKMKEGTGGYFNSADEFPKAELAYSNEREMLYFNSTYLDFDRTKVFLAHEFQHLITFYQKEKLKGLMEDVWLNEARSEYASTICGYDDVYTGSNLEKRANEFLRNPSSSLTEWENKSEDYGSVNLFMQYLVSRYSEKILAEMMRSYLVGIASINEALTNSGVNERFPEIFTNWTIANFVNDCQLGVGQRYCYLKAGLSYQSFHLNPSASNILKTIDGETFSFSDSVKDWAGRWYEISTPGFGLNFALNFSGGNGSNFQIPAIIYYANGRKEIRYLKMSNGEAAEIFRDFGDFIKSVVIVPSNQTKISGFSVSDPTYNFSYIAKITSSGQPIFGSFLSGSAPTFVSPAQNSAPNYPNGSLLRAKGDNKVFVVNGKFKRWIQSPEIFVAYPHFGWQNIIEVAPSELNWYQDAWLVRADGDSRVYEINGDLSKHWLNMSAEQFGASGRLWDMVFIINKLERDLYKTGAAVLK